MKPIHAALVAAFLFVSPAHADSPEATEYSAINDVSEMVLSSKQCPLEPHHGFAHYAYVVQKGAVIAEGCWSRHGSFVDIWIPAINSHFQLNANEFKPRTTL
jgi:hypothetical protein